MLNGKTEIQKMTGSRILDDGNNKTCTLPDRCEESRFAPCVHTTTGLHRFMSLMRCLTSFKRHNNLTSYHTRYEDDEQHIRLGWMTGQVVVQWFQEHFILEYEGLTVEQYRSLRTSFDRYWKRDNNDAPKEIKDRLILGKF